MTPHTTLPHHLQERIEAFGFLLDDTQLHIGGERSVMSSHKLVLTGKEISSEKRVIIKVSLDAHGAEDILREHRVRELLSSASFSLRSLLFPTELFFHHDPNLTISVTEFIDQDRVYVEYPLREQFFMALSWFETQEEFHATTYEHIQTLESVVQNWHAQDYERDVHDIRTTILSSLESTRAQSALGELSTLIHSESHLIDRYSGFLNHTDFVPHNFRIKTRALYVLDQVAIWFGNKYEGWARFVNYMTLHNPPLAQLLVSYIAEHRGATDAYLLRIMRCYKIAVLLRYYARAIASTEGNLKKLSEIRFEFWLTALERLLEGEELSDNYIAVYKEERDRLRSDEEKERQREFAVA